MKISVNTPAVFFENRPDLNNKETRDFLQDALPRQRPRTNEEKSHRAQTLREIANRLGVPGQYRRAPTTLNDFLHQLRLHLWRRFQVEEMGIKAGDPVIYLDHIRATVINIQPSFYLTLQLPGRRKRTAAPSTVRKGRK